MHRPAIGLLVVATALLATLLAACGAAEEATATPVPIQTSTATLEPTSVVLGDCLDGMTLQPGEGCRYTGGGSPPASVVLSVQHDGAICREGGPARQEIGGITLNMDSLRLCVSGGFERDDAFQSDIVASENDDGSWTFYESRLSASSERATPGSIPSPTPAGPAVEMNNVECSGFGSYLGDRYEVTGEVYANRNIRDVQVGFGQDSFRGSSYVYDLSREVSGNPSVDLGSISAGESKSFELSFSSQFPLRECDIEVVWTELTASGPQSASDRAVLVAFYHSTGGASWNFNTYWLSDRPIGDWHGVTTDSNGRVIRLSLVSKQLTGEIPPELGGLSSLTALFLGSNQLTGEIPPELGGLSNLTELDLGSNQLTGEIPPELGGLSRLTDLRLRNNRLTGEIPPELGGLSNLRQLSLSGNQLTGEIPPELGGLSNLNRLWLHDNQLTGCIREELRDAVLGPLNLPDCR